MELRAQPVERGSFCSIGPGDEMLAVGMAAAVPATFGHLLFDLPIHPGRHKSLDLMRHFP